jgi:hypothetical protein
LAELSWPAPAALGIGMRADVVAHYNRVRNLSLTMEQQ